MHEQSNSSCTGSRPPSRYGRRTSRSMRTNTSRDGVRAARSPIRLGCCGSDREIVPAGRDGGGRRWAEADRWFGATRRRRAGSRRCPARSRHPLAASPRHRHETARAQPLSARPVCRPRRRLGGSWIADGVIVPVPIGIRDRWFVHAEDIPLLEQIEAGAFTPTDDPLVAVRQPHLRSQRTQALWNFEFRLEIYVPKSQRWGYFVMPLLHGDRLIGPLRSLGGSCCAAVSTSSASAGSRAGTEPGGLDALQSAPSPTSQVRRCTTGKCLIWWIDPTAARSH